MFAAVHLPGGTASASASLTSLGFAGSDSTHWAVGAPGAGARTDYYFGVEGAGEVVTLRFKFVTAGGWAWDDASSFTSSGAFSILLQSATGPAPYVTAILTLVQCLGCGGRLGGGSLTTTTDLYGPGVSTTVPWLGEPVGEFSLTSSFVTGVENAGRFALDRLGGAGNGSFNFNVSLESVTRIGGPGGDLALSLPRSGGSFGVSVGGAGVSAVPEPAAAAIWIAALALLVGCRWRRRVDKIDTIDRADS